jgi:ribosomal protein S12 methylthiotransferase
MNASGNPKPVIGLVSLGCAKNLVDSELLLRQLAHNNIQVVFEPQSVDLLDGIIINTCGFITDAKEESVNTILEFVTAKQEGRLQKVIVMGCLSERYRVELQKEFPEVDGFFGVNELPAVIRLLDGTFNSSISGERILTTPAHYAYLKIAEGCNRRCSFCAIPEIRGKHRSRPVDDIVQEAKYLVRQGVKELLLISQDTTWYGIDRSGKREIANLMQRLAEESGAAWLRLHYTHPHQFPPDLLDVFQRYANICHYVDMPLQHINDGMLKSMRRGTDGTTIKRLIHVIREKLPDVSLRSTFITGYPGETETVFHELMHFLEDYRFDRVGAFSYSHEEGTPAYDLNDSVPEKIKLERQEAILSLQETISVDKNEEKIGKKIRVLVDEQEGDYWVARTEGDSPEIDETVLIPVKESALVAGNFYDVVVTDAAPFELMAKLPATESD